MISLRLDARLLLLILATALLLIVSRKPRSTQTLKRSDLRSDLDCLFRVASGESSLRVVDSLLQRLVCLSQNRHVVLDFLQIGRCSARRVAGCGTVDKSNGDGGDDSIDICWTAGIAILKVKRD